MADSAGQLPADDVVGGISDLAAVVAAMQSYTDADVSNMRSKMLAALYERTTNAEPHIKNEFCKRGSPAVCPALPQHAA